MTTHTIHPHHHLSGRGVVLAVASTALAATAGYGVYTWVTDDPRATAPAPAGDTGHLGDSVPPSTPDLQKRLKLEQLQ